MELFENGLFMELGEVAGHDPVLYEDLTKQPNFNTLSSIDYTDDEISGEPNSLALGGDVFQTLQGENELESLVAEGNHLLEELMLANGLQLIEGEPVDLGNIDEIAVPVSLVSPHTDDMFNSDPVFMDYPLSDLSNGCSSPVSSFSLPTLGEQSELSDLLESLLEESGDSSSYIDDDVSSPSSPASSFYSISEEDNSPKPEKKRRATPYSKLPAGRKERKKQQNKEAAIRYREKKRSEAQEITGEEDRLSSVNKTLKSDVLNLEREIACMKELLSDVFDIHSL